MYEVAKLQQYEIDETGTTLVIHIPDVNLQETILRRHLHRLGVWLEDGRHITAEQRKKIYATIADIADYTGYLPEEQKEFLKLRHMTETGCKYFSLSNCSVDTAREFINTILDYALYMGVPLTDFGIHRTDDIEKYLYMCLKYRKCAVCGRSLADQHHWDAIGMGRDRNHVDDSELRKIALCRTHHTEAHTIGREAFTKKYLVYGIKYVD